MVTLSLDTLINKARRGRPEAGVMALVSPALNWQYLPGARESSAARNMRFFMAEVVKLLGNESLSWDDFATWRQDLWIVEWNIRTSVFTEAVTCAGKNTFIEIAPDKTRLEIHGDISIDVKKVRGVPSFLAGSIGKTVENFLVKQITANLTSVSDALSRYLREKG
jgi:hypothetical protein